MKETIEVTYTKTATVTEYQQDCIAQCIYDAFIDELSDDILDIDAIPGDTLKEIFVKITQNMLEDDEFWGD